MASVLLKALEDCARRLEGGATLDECFERYPRLVPEISDHFAFEADLAKTAIPSPLGGAPGRERLLGLVEGASRGRLVSNSG